MIDWAGLEAAVMEAASGALERGAIKVAVRAKQLAPYRRVTEEQEATVRTRLKTRSEIRADRSIRERLGLAPDISGASRIVVRRAPQLPDEGDTLSRRGRFEVKRGEAAGHLRDRIYASPPRISGRIIRARVISPAPYSKYQEFGTANTPAHPFMRPAAHEAREALKADVAKGVAAAIRSRMSGRIEATITMRAR